MTGPLSQVVTLATFGNDFLFNDKLIEDFASNRSFKFCNTVDFRIFKKSIFGKEQKENVIANNPNEWFAYLKQTGCKKLRLYFRSSEDQSFAKDYKLAGLTGGGGTWFIEAVYGSYSNAWASRWLVTKKDDPNHNIWTVNYGQTLSNLPVADVQHPLEECREELEQTLTEIEAFALAHNLEPWAKQFTEAKRALQSDAPENFYYNKELIPLKNYSLIAKQILFAAATGWVFGAMGSWNDLGFNTAEENEKYEKLSEQLYERINRAILSSVNSY